MRAQYWFRGLLLILLFITACASVPANAMSPDLVAQTWSTENGLPQNSVHAVLQTRDGYVWLGTEAGLARFDGYSFDIFGENSTPRLPGEDIRALLEDASGALWIATDAGLSRLTRGTVRSYLAGAGGVSSMTETADGRLWVITANGLDVARLRGVDPAKIRFAPVAGSAGINVTAIVAHGQDSVWVATAQGLMHAGNGSLAPVVPVPGKPPSSPLSLPVDAMVGSNSGLLFADAAGVFRLRAGTAQTVLDRAQLPAGGARLLVPTTDGVWVAGRDSVVFAAAHGSRLLRAGRELPGTQVTACLAAQDGTVWIGTNVGVVRVDDAGAANETVHRVDAVQGSVLTLYQDRDRNLWAGLDMAGASLLHPRLFQSLPGTGGAGEPAATAVLEAPDGALWLGTNGGGVIERRSAGTRTYTTTDGLASNTILALAESPVGDLWVGTPDGLSVLHGGRWKTYTSGEGLADDLVRSLLVAQNGTVWIGSRHGVTLWRNGAMTILTHAQGLASDLVGPMLEQPDGTVWIGTSHGLSRARDGHVQSYTRTDGLPGNTITALGHSSLGGLWIGTDSSGLARWDGSRFHSFTGVRALPSTVYAAMEDGRGSLWLASAHGLFRIAVADLARYEDDRRGVPPVATYGATDGLASADAAGTGYPAAWRLTDGRLCFVTQRGILVALPSRSPADVSPPPAVLESITVDDRALSAQDGLTLSAASSHFAFTFAGIRPAAPQRVQYRYRLSGVDHDWVDSGVRRTAYYTNIPPGRHVFEFCARDAGGAWSRPGSLKFRLRPHLVQTWEFWVAVACLLGLLIAGVYRLRLRAVESQFNAVSAERNRLAREIHDTLAQSFVAVSMRLELMAQLLRSPGSERACLEQVNETRTMVRESLAEARRSIWELRSDGDEANILPARLSRMVREAAAVPGVVRLRTGGSYRPLDGRVEDELFRMAQEAVANAVRHAHAQAIEVSADYALDALVLEVRDDGRGFDPAAAPARAGGHFGLTGLRERAQLIGAGIMLESSPGAGTRVRVTLPLSPVRAKARS